MRKCKVGIGERGNELEGGGGKLSPARDFFRAKKAHKNSSHKIMPLLSVFWILNFSSILGVVLCLWVDGNFR